MRSTTNHVTAKGQTSYLDNTTHVNFLFYGSPHLQSDNIKFRAFLCSSLDSPNFPKIQKCYIKVSGGIFPSVSQLTKIIWP